MAAFDTAEHIEELEKAGFEHRHARAIVRLVWRSHEALLNSKTEHKIDLLRKDLDAVEERLNTKIDGLENRLLAKLGKLMPHA
ncbi:DUF1640 domain-containing protein [Ventosimonas gracilis]|nr:DUF1640 domain-containing protein [Ventosimonas gracilis]